MIPPSPTKRSCRIFRISTTLTAALTSPTIGSTGRFTRLLTPTVGVVIDNSWIARNWGAAKRGGFDVTSVGLKWEVFRDNPHETLLSAALAWGIQNSGAQGVNANAPNTIRPGLFFGKGFGDLPDSVSWLRPFGVTAAIVLEHPTGSVSKNFGIDPINGQLGPMTTSNVDILHWGFAVEFSTLYLTSRFTGGPPNDEPLNQLVPLVEFAFDSSRGTKTIATMNPGLSSPWKRSCRSTAPRGTPSVAEPNCCCFSTIWRPPCLEDLC
jgi:hypothetical protein